jgi:hypothetical protein
MSEKAVVVGVPTFGAGTVSSGQSRRLVEKEEPCVAAVRHRLAVAPSKLQPARDPTAAIVAPADPTVFVVQPSTVAENKPPLRRLDQLSERRNSVPQRHSIAYTRNDRLTSGRAEVQQISEHAYSVSSCTLNSATSATIDATTGGDAGLYLSNGKSLSGDPLANAEFSFTYFCGNTTDISSCTGGGIPRWSIPISTDGNSKTTEGYAFMDGANCLAAGTQTSGNALTVSTTVATCPVFFGPTEYTNWDAFAATKPSYTISGDLPFVISDEPTASPQIVSNLIATKS